MHDGADLKDLQEAQLLEPHKCTGWEWVEWGKLPQPMFEPLEKLSKSAFKLPTAKELLEGTYKTSVSSCIMHTAIIFKLTYTFADVVNKTKQCKKHSKLINQCCCLMLNHDLFFL
jgi:hypothetical protein